MPSIYLTENIYNKERGILPWRYIGSDQGDSVMYCGSNKKLKEDLALLGHEYFIKTIIEYYPEIDNKTLRRIEADNYLRPNNVRTDPTYYNESETYSPGCGKKGMKHSKIRSEEHRNKIVKHRTGSIKSPESRDIMRQKKLGSKASEQTKRLMSRQRKGSLNNNALEWTIISPESVTYHVKGLRSWAKENGFKFRDIYYSLNGWKSIKHGNGKGGGRPKKELHNNER